MISLWRLLWTSALLRCLLLQDQHLSLKEPLTVRGPGCRENLLPLLSNAGCSKLCHVQADWIFRGNKLRLYLIPSEEFSIQTSKGSIFISASIFTIDFGTACLYCPICFSTGCYFLKNVLSFLKNTSKNIYLLWIKNTCFPKVTNGQAKHFICMPQAFSERQFMGKMHKHFSLF